MKLIENYSRERELQCRSEKCNRKGELRDLERGELERDGFGRRLERAWSII